MNISKNLRDNKFLLVIFSLALFLFVLFFQKNFNGFLSFSDAAKFAGIARSVVRGNGYTSNFSFFNSEVLGISGFSPVSSWILPLMPLAIAGFFRIFGVSDLSVMWGEIVGVLSAVVVAANVNFLEYATSGASETLFALEIVLASYLFIFKKKNTNLIGFVVLIIMYLTRPQAIIYIFGLVFLYLLLNFPVKKALKYVFVIFILGSGLYLAISEQGLFAVTQHLPGIAPSDALRGGVQEVNIIELIKKTFYNLYNFYRLLPQIASPYMWGLFVIGFFHWTKNKEENALKLASILMVAVTFLVTALTIPFFRYLHPVVPLVYLFATATLVWIVEKLARDLRFKIYELRINISKRKFVNLASLFLILIFVVGQTLGVIFLDSRFKAKTVNRGKPPVYVQLAWLLRDNSNSDDVVVTNLDTWGSWYGERKTVWFPLEPDQLIDLKNDFDAIYLTSYLIDDENYYMGEAWREIYLNPKEHANEFIGENYEFAGEFEVSPEETYENKPARSILLVRKQ